MQLVEVDIVSAEAAQRSIDRIEQALPRRALLPGMGTHPADCLGGDNEIVALALQPAPDDFFRRPGKRGAATERIDVRRVDEVDAALCRLVKNGMRSCLFGLKPEGHGSKAKAGNGQAGAAELAILHLKL